MQGSGQNRGRLVLIAGAIAVLVIGVLVVSGGNLGGLFGSAVSQNDGKGGNQGGGQGQGQGGGQQGGGQQGGGQQGGGQQGGGQQGGGNQGGGNQGGQGGSDKKITICHVPPGNPDNPQTITISVNAWRADGQGPGGHGPGLHGGDYEGPCKTVEKSKTPGNPEPTKTKGGPDKTKTPGPEPTDHKIIICHVPPGNPDNAHTISIDANAWKADGSGKGGHGPGLHGGDSLGPCPPKASKTPNPSATPTATFTGTPPTPTATFTGTPPTASPTPTQIACGQQTDANGFPIVDPKCPPDDHPTPEPAPWEPVEVKPAPQCVDNTLYHSNKSGPVNIFQLKGTGGQNTNDANISRGSGDKTRDISPSRAPDNNWAAFSSNRTGNWEIYVTSMDGQTQQRVTYTTTAANLAPMWSPDGQYVAYESTRAGSRDLYMVEAGTGVETRLTDSPAQDVNPFWSPDSKTILFQSDRDGLWQLYSLDIATKKVTKVSDGKTNDLNPQYSPDGKKIAFRSYQGDNSVIMMMNTDGSGSKAVSDPKGNASNQVWSPDNALLAYQSNMDGDLDIYVYQAASGTTRKVTDNTTRDYAPTWRCGGSILVFTSDDAGNPNIYQAPALPINAQPVKPASYTQLTFDKAVDQNPQNSPAVEDASYRSTIGNPPGK
jgi:Tol biopolymer transport system component